MVGFSRKLARRFGFDLTPFPGGATHWRRITALLADHSVDCVFDVGANIGQYATSIRRNGYAGRILSFEPLTSAHAEISARAAGDPHWDIAPRTAVGAAVGETEIPSCPSTKPPGSASPAAAPPASRPLQSRQSRRPWTPTRTPGPGCS